MVTNADARALDFNDVFDFHGDSLAVVDVLERLAVILALQEGDDLLKGVARGGGNAQLVALDGDLAP